MQKRIKLFLICISLIVPTLLSGCASKNVSYKDNRDAYIKTLDYHDNFTVLQLSDLHISQGTQLGDGSYGLVEYLLKVILEAEDHIGGKIDLIEITGDTFMLAAKGQVEYFIDTMESIGIPYAIGWGNHDREGIYDPNWFSDRFMNAPHSLYTEVDNDDVHGRCNYVVNLVDGTDTVWQLFTLDSGASYRDGAADTKMTYDYIREDQYQWLEFMHEENAPALLYYHIAQKDAVELFTEVKKGNDDVKRKFFEVEGMGESKYAANPLELCEKLNVKGVFFGHCHANDMVMTAPNGIVYGFGVKTGIELYSAHIKKGDESGGIVTDEDFDLNGASLVTILDREGNFKLEHLYLNEKGKENYTKDSEEDLVMWVEYDG